ncbi:MAG: hypothetical protein E2O41_06685 [Nitrospina sp.]|nr:MAG: hypothetical protein E2O41_06685 [Nitrospina sp.]
MSGKITIKFTNGNEQNYEIEPQAQQKMVGSKLKELLNSNALVIQLEKELEIIPFANIQIITVLPAEDILSGGPIQGTVVAKRSS